MWRWPRRSEKDFAEEIAANIAIDAERLIAEGMNAEDANATALRAFGNVTRTQERFYESRRVMWLDDPQRDVRHAVRDLRRHPGFTTTVAPLSDGLSVLSGACQEGALYSTSTSSGPTQSIRGARGVWPF